MKSVTASLAAVLIAAATLATACTTSPAMRSSRLDPAINLNGPRTIEAGESTHITAQTENLVASRGIQWSASPNVAKIQREDNSGQSALFTADQPGTYVVTAFADTANGGRVESRTTVTVRPRPVAGNVNNPNNPNNNSNYNNNNNNANNR
jgi:hypothetical protein